MRHQLYTGLNCQHCSTVKQLLKEANIPYIELDISSDMLAKDHLVNTLQVRRIPCLVDIDNGVAGVGIDEIKDYIEGF